MAEKVAISASYPILSYPIKEYIKVLAYFKFIFTIRYILIL